MNGKLKNYVVAFMISAILTMIGLYSCNKDPGLRKEGPGIFNASVDTNVINFADSTGQLQE